MSTIDRELNNYVSSFCKRPYKCGKVAVIDIDDTLGQVFPLILNWIRVEFDKPDFYYDFKEYNLHKVSELLYIEPKDFQERLYSSGILKEFRWFPFARKFIESLRSGFITGEPCHIALVTKRLNFWQDAVNLTYDHTFNGVIDFCSLNIMSFYNCKVEWVIAQFGKENISVIVEDGEDALIKSINLGIDVLKVEQPYNTYIETKNIVDLVEGYVTFNGKTRIL